MLFALVKSGHLDEAYLMLLRLEAPSWLYQVEMGATTVWERWDALAPDGTIHSGEMATNDSSGMLSFNHYAYGAVVDWIYRYVAGIAPTTEHPGYRRVIVAPRPAVSIDWARASVESRLGPVSIDWRLNGSDLEIDSSAPLRCGRRARSAGHGCLHGLGRRRTARRRADRVGCPPHRRHRGRVADPAVALVPASHRAAAARAGRRRGRRRRQAAATRTRRRAVFATTSAATPSSRMTGAPSSSANCSPSAVASTAEPERGDRLHEVAHDVGGRDDGGAVVGGSARRDESEAAREREAVAGAGHERRRDEGGQRVVEPGDDEQPEADDREHRARA